MSSTELDSKISLRNTDTITGLKSIRFGKHQPLTVVMDCPISSDLHPLQLIRSRVHQDDLNESLKVYSKSIHGFGEYRLPSRSRYVGALKTGEFHGLGRLYLPNGTECRGVWNEGHHTKGKIIFEDGLEWAAAKWQYCTPEDRRFYSEIVNGLKPAGRSQLTNRIPPPTIPTGCYDTGDGFYNPETRIVTGYTGKFVRYANDDEHAWIISKCRKGWDEVVGKRNIQ